MITSRWRTPEAPSREPGIERTLHLQWGPPYPPEDLAGLLTSEASDREAVQRCVDEWSPDVIDIWGMEFASQSLVTALAGGRAAVHLTIEDVWLLLTHQFDPLVSIRRIADSLSVPIPSALAGLLCQGAGPPDVCGAGVSFVSNSLAQRYARGGFEHSRSRVRLAGIDVTRFVSRRPADPLPFVILFVGQLTATRGTEDLMQAACAAEIPNIELRFVGAGSNEYLRRLTVIAKQFASQKLRIEFVGAVDPADMAKVYRDAHLFVHASRLPEGLPIVLMEAMVSGVPIIATDGGGQCDILENGKWGRLIPTGDVDAMAGAIVEAVKERPEWERRAARAREHAVRSFDIEQYVDGHLDDLRSAMEHERQPKQLLHVDSRAAAAVSNGFRDQLAAAAKTAADSDEAWRLGAALKRCGALSEARELFERLARSDRADDVRRGSFHLAEIAIVSHQWAEAETQLRCCLESAPDHRKARYDLDFVSRKQIPPHLSGLIE